MQRCFYTLRRWSTISVDIVRDRGGSYLRTIEGTGASKAAAAERLGAIAPRWFCERMGTGRGKYQREATARSSPPRIWSDCPMDGATQARAVRPRSREASWARAPNSPWEGEGRDARTARPDEEGISGRKNKTPN